MSAEPIEALEREVERTGHFLGGLDASDWELPTRCPPLSVRELASHAARGARRILEMVSAGTVPGEPEKDAVTYFQYDPAAEGGQIVARAQAEGAGALGLQMPGSWKSAWAEALPAARARTEENPVLQSPFGTIRLREYLRTRCVEVTIHAMDLRDALGLEPDPTPEGIEAACDVLRGLLGTDLRPLGVDDVRFALTGSGRAELGDSEREMLGPLADRFPLFQ